MGSRSARKTSAMSEINPSVGIVLTSSTAILTSIAYLTTNENNNEIKQRYANLRGWIKVITLFFEKTLNQSMVDKKID